MGGGSLMSHAEFLCGGVGCQLYWRVGRGYEGVGGMERCVWVGGMEGCAGGPVSFIFQSPSSRLILCLSPASFLQISFLSHFFLWIVWYFQSTQDVVIYKLYNRGC